jgi:hypothetical protein
MTEVPKIVPKIVYDRLQAAGQSAQGRVHPDADVLTAFAEQALSVTEREGILGHLALCLDCREVVALALPPAGADVQITDVTHGVYTTPSRSGAPAPHKFQFARPNLRWAALAAGVAVVASVLLVYPGKLNLALLPSATRQIPPPVSGTQIASSSMDQAPVLAKTEAPQPKTELQPSKDKDLKAREAITGPPQAVSGMQLATNQKPSVRADKLPKLPVTGGAMFDSASPSRAANETVEVSAAASEPSPAPSPEGTLMARNEAPAIEKAKPALQGIETESGQLQQTPAAAAGSLRLQARNMMTAAKASRVDHTLAPNVVWIITAGVLQRSLDSGATWQNALHAEHPLLCYANHGEDVWAGGRAGTLFHSADSGVTWVQVEASINSKRLTSDVTHIDLTHVDGTTAAEIVLVTTNHEIWSSLDDGKSWDKK